LSSIEKLPDTESIENMLAMFLVTKRHRVRLTTG
jgi:hypothetical protein